MGRMSELDETIKELRNCGETLIGISETLRSLFSNTAESVVGKRVEPEAQPEEKVREVKQTAAKEVSKEDVRKVLGIKLREGFRDQIQELFHKYGGERLKEIDPSKYADLLKDAEELKNA